MNGFADHVKFVKNLLSMLIWVKNPIGKFRNMKIMLVL